MWVFTKTIPSALWIVAKEVEIEIDKTLSIGENVEVHLLVLTVLAHLYTIQSQLAANFLLEITPAEDVLEVAIAAEPEESFDTINRLGEILFAHERNGDKREGRKKQRKMREMGKVLFSFLYSET